MNNNPYLESRYAIDLGTQYLRVGACGDAEPNYVLFNGTLNDQVVCWHNGNVWVPNGNEERVYENLPSNMSQWWSSRLSSTASMSYGISNRYGWTGGSGSDSDSGGSNEQGHLSMIDMDEDVMESLLQTILGNVNIDNKGDLPSTDCAILLGISDTNVCLVSDLSELLFEEFEIHSMACISQLESLTFSRGQSSSSIINIGAGSIEGGSISYGEIQSYPALRSPVQGTRHYTSMFLQALRREKSELRYLDMNNPVHMQCIDIWRSDLVNQRDVDQENHHQFILPDGTVFQFDRDTDSELMNLPLRLMFDNELVRSHLPNKNTLVQHSTIFPRTVTGLIEQSIRRLPLGVTVPHRFYCLGDVSVRLCDQLQPKLASDVSRYRLTTNNDNFIQSWLGLSICGSLSTFDPVMYSRQAYLELGPYRPFSKLLRA